MNFDLDQSINILKRTPSVLNHLLRELPETLTHENEGPDTWSPYDVVGHLVHGEKTDWLPRIQIIMNDSDQKTFEPYDRFAQFRMSKGKTLQDLLDEFEVLRNRNVTRLQEFSLHATDLERQGIHPSLGPVTMRNLISAWVVHDMGHITQIARVMAKQYKETVGPWTQYLTVLKHTPKE